MAHSLNNLGVRPAFELKITDVTNTKTFIPPAKDVKNEQLAKTISTSKKENNLKGNESDKSKIGKESPQKKQNGLQGEKGEIVAKMCFQVVCGTSMDEISEEIVKNADGKRALIFLEYFKKFQNIEHEFLGKRSYDNFAEEKQEKEDQEDEEEKQFKKLLKVSKEKGKEISKAEQEKKMLRNSIPYYIHKEFFFGKIRPLALFQQELEAFKKFVGADREEIIEKAVEGGLNPVYYIYLFKIKEKTLKDIQTAMRKSNKNFDYWDLVIEYINSLIEKKD